MTTFPDTMRVNGAMPDIVVLGERIRVEGPDRALVASNSHPGEWHVVERGDDGEFACSCKGFECRKVCRHRDAILCWLRGWEIARVYEGDE